MRRCKSVSPHYISHPHELVSGPHRRVSLLLPPPLLLPALGAPGEHRRPAMDLVSQLHTELQM